MKRLILFIPLCLLALSTVVAQLEPNRKNIKYYPPDPQIERVYFDRDVLVLNTNRGDFRISYDFVTPSPMITRETTLKAVGKDTYKFTYSLSGMPVRDYQIEVKIRSPARMENEGCYINDFNLTECDTEYQYKDLVIDFLDIYESDYNITTEDRGDDDQRLRITIPSSRINRGGVVLDPITHSGGTITISGEDATLLDINASINDPLKFMCYAHNAPGKCGSNNFRYMCETNNKLRNTLGTVLTLNNDCLIYNFTADTNYALEIDTTSDIFILNDSRIRGKTNDYQIVAKFGSGFTAYDSFFSDLGYGTGNNRNGLWIHSSSPKLINCTINDSAKWAVSIGADHVLNYYPGNPENALIANNSINNGGIRGIGLWGCKECNITGNTIYSFTGQGIQINRRTQILPNTVYHYTEDTDISYNTINGNNAGQYGINFNLGQNTERINITNNDIKRLRKAQSDVGIAISGRDHVLSNNNISQVGYISSITTKWGASCIALNQANDSYINGTDCDSIGGTLIAHNAFYMTDSHHNTIENNIDLGLEWINGKLTRTVYLGDSSNNTFIDPGLNYCPTHLISWAFFMSNADNNAFYGMECNRPLYANVGLYGGSDNNHFEDVDLTPENSGAYWAFGVDVEDSTNNTFKDSIIDCYGGSCGACSVDEAGCTIAYNYDDDCTVAVCDTYKTYFINVTHDGGDDWGSDYIYWATRGFPTYIQNYLQIRALYSGVGIQGADLTIYNVTGEILETDLTDLQGYSDTFTLTRFVVNASNYTHWSNWTAELDRECYAGSNTSFNFSSPTLLNISMDRIRVCRPTLYDRVLLRQESTNAPEAVSPFWLLVCFIPLIIGILIRV